MQKPYALFDFDGTLIRGDSIVRFVRYAHARGLIGAGGLLRFALAVCAGVAVYFGLSMGWSYLTRKSMI